MESLAKQFVIFGLALIGIGGLLWLSNRLPWLRLGRLPGDLYVQRDGFSFIFPLATGLLLSLVLTAGMWLYRFFRH
jgi:hypothetical protein